MYKHFSSDLMFLSVILQFELQVADSSEVRFEGVLTCSDVILYNIVYLKKEIDKGDMYLMYNSPRQYLCIVWDSVRGQSPM